MNELNIIQGVTSGLDLDNKWMADTINEVSVDEVEVISMSIEDSIKNAMKELGIESSDDLDILLVFLIEKVEDLGSIQK